MTLLVLKKPSGNNPWFWILRNLGSPLSQLPSSVCLTCPVASREGIRCSSHFCLSLMKLRSSQDCLRNIEDSSYETNSGSTPYEDISHGPILSPIESSLETVRHCLTALNLDSPSYILSYFPKEQTGLISFPLFLRATFRGIYVILRFKKML